MNLHVALAHLEQDKKLRPLLDQIEMPNFTPSGRLYYDLLASIVSQQLSVKVADVIFKRFLALFPENYPYPNLVVSIDVDLLRGVGLSGQKANYLQNVAHFAIKNNLDAIDWSSMSDEEIITFLTQIKGVGKWTVQMLLMFSLARPDVFPADDLGIQQSMQRLFEIQDKNPRTLKQRIIELAEPWRPWRTIACRYLWRWKDS